MTNLFNKPPINIQNIILKIIQYGITITDQNEVIELFKFVNYYRVLPYIKIKPNHYASSQHQTFTNIKKLYIADKKLRGLLCSSTESIENFIRHDITEYFTSSNKNFFTDFLQPHIGDVVDSSGNKTLYGDLKKTFDNTKNQSVLYYKENYHCDFSEIPIWVLLESLDFGQIIWFITEIFKFDNNTNNFTLENIIWSKYNLKPKVYKASARCTKDLRNTCAHGIRLYANTLRTQKPNFPWQITDIDGTILTPTTTTGLYCKLLGLKCFYKKRQDPWFDFIFSLNEYFEENKSLLSTSDYFFKENWQTILLDTW